MRPGTQSRLNMCSLFALLAEFGEQRSSSQLLAMRVSPQVSNVGVSGPLNI